ncbi:MAG: efflux RND transporter periplasmic adaptor subunit [Woeseiaceae bacterium]|nr:efflux RND transporter periplasmic adaptor subunit [Woeseiaceae bacterium]
MTRRTVTPICGLLAAIFLSACSEAPEQGAVREPRAVPVIADIIRYEEARSRIEAVGTSRAALSAELHPAASGDVIAVRFEPGQSVREGDVLVELDSREERLNVELAELKLEDARRLYDRYSRSADSGAVLPTTLDAARTALESARVELDQALLALAERSIQATFDGHVGASEVDPGDRVDPASMITTLDDRRTLLVSFEIPEAYIGELQRGDRVRLETWNSTTPAVEGEIVDTGSRVDPQNRTIIARASIDNSDDKLRPGMSFRVSADVEGNRYAVVKETALQWGAEGAYIWSIVDGTAQRVPVTVIQRREGRVLIDGDFAGSDMVVIEGTQRMRDGVAVEYDDRQYADDAKRGSAVSEATSGFGTASSR